MLITLQISVPGTPSGSIVKSLKDLLNEARSSKNVYPKIGDFCKYLSLVNTGGGQIHVVGSSSAVLADSGLILPSDADFRPFVLEDMTKGLVPLQDIYLLSANVAAITLRVILIQD